MKITNAAAFCCLIMVFGWNYCAAAQLQTEVIKSSDIAEEHSPQEAPGSGQPRSFIVRSDYSQSPVDLDNRAVEQLDQIVKLISLLPIGHILVYGHTDSTAVRSGGYGTFTNNYGLSEQRAWKVADYLREKLQLKQGNITVSGMGPDYPVRSNDSFTGKVLNRRVEIVVLPPGSDTFHADTPYNELSKGGSQLEPSTRSTVTISLKDVDIAEVMAMLARKERINILLAKDVQGDVSLNLYGVSVDQAVRSIASAAGYAVEWRQGIYYVVNRSEAGKYAEGGISEVRAFKIQYSDPKTLAALVKNHLSNYGKVTALEARSLLVVEDIPAFIRRVELLLRDVDRKPKQILIEAKILEVNLSDGDAFGVDWKRIFSNGDGSFGATGLTSPSSPGFFLDFLTPKMELALNMLHNDGRVRTLSTPKLMALENQQASVVIGDRIGYRVTTTVNQVTTESIEFLESGVILKVKPIVDAEGRILLDIHPEVSTGTVQEGIPAQSTTEVTTQLLVGNGQTVFIGGLLKRNVTESREGVPLLGDLPLLGRLFSSNKIKSVNTETVVMITPHIVDDHNRELTLQQLHRIRQAEQDLKENNERIETKMRNRYDGGNGQTEPEATVAPVP